MSLYSRSVLDSELADVRRKIIQLSSLVDTAIERAMTALMDRQVEMARQVQEDDEQINRLRYEVD